MITDVSEAVMKAFRSDVSLRSLLLGGLYYHQAPQNVSYPYGVFSHIGTRQDEIMGDYEDFVGYVNLQFDLYSSNDDGGQEIAELTRLLRKLLEANELIIDGYSFLRMEFEAELPVEFTDEIWHSAVTYNVILQKV